MSQDAPADDPFDFSVLEADISAVIERLKNDLSKLRAGGRFNPEVLEVLRVQPDKASNQTVKLSDVAQVIPKGRIVHIMVGEQDVSLPRSIRAIEKVLTSDPSTSNPSPQPSNPATSHSHRSRTQLARIHSSSSSTSPLRLPIPAVQLLPRLSRQARRPVWPCEMQEASSKRFSGGNATIQNRAAGRSEESWQGDGEGCGEGCW